MNFADLGLEEQTLQALEKLGYTTPTPIQEQTIPALLQGRDVVGQAQTGTGKTAAFGIPLVEAGRAGRRALVLTPTRELAKQVQQELQALNDGHAVVVLIGGASFGHQVGALGRHPMAPIVATPGRTLDHIEKGTLNINDISMFVLDEADEMLSMGFADELDAIVSHLPAERQTVLFTATLAPAIERLANKTLHDPITVRIGKGPTSQVAQCYATVAGKDRADAVRRILLAEEPRAALLFARTRDRVEELAGLLKDCQADALHGGMPQPQRDAVMGRLRRGQTQLLVATDVAARGLDVDEIDLVLHDELGADTETYIHRMGRTGRAGRTGTSILFINPGKIKRLGMLKPVTGQLAKYDIPDDNALAGIRTARIVGRIAEQPVHESAKAALEQAEASGLSHRELALRLLSRELETPAVAEPEVSETAALALKVGKMDDVHPGAIVGVLCNAAGMTAKDVGRIDILEKMCVVEIPSHLLQQACDSLGRVRLSGRPLMPREASDWRFKSSPRFV